MVPFRTGAAAWKCGEIYGKGRQRQHPDLHKGAFLVVEDNGIGIRPEDIPRVFEWGYTGYNGRREKRSTGIGLFLCRRTMDMLGQTIAIESEEGKGTRVLLGISRNRFDIE